MEALLISLAPLLIVIIIWIFIMYRFKKYNKTNNFAVNQTETISLLKEIRDELKELNKNNSQKQ